ncbi:MAG: hypothetical protein J5787_04665 [Alphaproteobacteria bacterium]|nr:hypothetical protein [Alphaproteobacteria bacterium]MBO4643063.1 hypothetical protein [Alphaproteobacteria bacterium]
MFSLVGRLCVIAFFLAATGFPSAAFAAKYSGVRTKNRFVAEKTVKKKPLPAAAVALPEKETRAADAITFEELHLFVRDWRKYARWLKKNDNEYKAVAYLGVSPSTDYPPEVVKWMDEHGWAVDRFFLLERKFRQTLSVQKQEAKQNTLISHLEKQIQDVERNHSLTQAQKKEMIDQYLQTISSVQASISGKAPVTQEEYNLIKLNHDVLARVLDE